MSDMNDPTRYWIEWMMEPELEGTHPFILTARMLMKASPADARKKLTEILKQQSNRLMETQFDGWGTSEYLKKLMRYGHDQIEWPKVATHFMRMANARKN